MSGIKKENRISNRNERSIIFKNGKRYANKYLKIFFMKNNIKDVRFNVMINKSFGRAVDRNKAKRHIRELFRINKNLICEGHDLIFFIKNEFKTLSFLEKKENFIKLLSRTGVLK